MSCRPGSTRPSRLHPPHRRRRSRRRQWRGGCRSRHAAHRPAAKRNRRSRSRAGPCHRSLTPVATMVLPACATAKMIDPSGAFDLRARPLPAIGRAPHRARAPGTAGDVSDHHEPPIRKLRDRVDLRVAREVLALRDTLPLDGPDRRGVGDGRTRGRIRGWRLGGTWHCHGDEQDRGGPKPDGS